MASPPWNCGVVRGQLVDAVLFGAQNSDVVYAPEGICEPELYIADGPELSVARAVELDDLSWTSRDRLDQGRRAARFLNAAYNL